MRTLYDEGQPAVPSPVPAYHKPLVEDFMMWMEHLYLS